MVLEENQGQEKKKKLNIGEKSNKTTVLAFSDAHDMLDEFPDQVAILTKKIKKADKAIYCGDGVNDLEKTFGDDAQKIIAVQSFSDIDDGRTGRNKKSSLPTERIIEICGKKILITHGDRRYYEVNYNNGANLFTHAKNLGFGKNDVIIHGHLHDYENVIDESTGIHRISVPAIAYCELNYSACLELVIDEKNIEVKLCNLDEKMKAKSTTDDKQS